MTCSPCMLEPPANTPYVRPSCRRKKRSASTTRSCTTGHSMQAETSPPHCSTSRHVWVDSGWAPRFSDTLQPLGQPGNQSFPPSWKPLAHQTWTPCLLTPTLRSQLHRLQIVSANECTLPPIQITWCGTSNTQIPKSTCQHNPTDNAPTTAS